MQGNDTSFNTIDEYIAMFPEEIRKTLSDLRAVIKAAAPDAKEKISYQMPTFAQEGNMIHFAAFKNHIGLYPAPRAIEEFSEELSKYEGSKGAIRFPIDQPLPMDLIRRIVLFRVAENLKKAELKKNIKKK